MMSYASTLKAWRRESAKTAEVTRRELAGLRNVDGEHARELSALLRMFDAVAAIFANAPDDVPDDQQGQGGLFT